MINFAGCHQQFCCLAISHAQVLQLLGFWQGAIQKAPNAVSFVYGIRSLHTTDAAEVLRTWNLTCPKSDQVSGRKVQSVRNLLDLPSDDLAHINHVVSEFGWDGFLLCWQCFRCETFWYGVVDVFVCRLS